MAEPSKVLWALDNETSGRDFERLCVDLLTRDGYWSIVPIGGTQDLGRDAEAKIWSGRTPRLSRVVFQFSLQERWEKKLLEDAKKIVPSQSSVKEFVFVTSRVVTGAKEAALSKKIFDSYGWHLTVFAREWLRLRLEEVYPDLAKKYFGIELPHTVSSIARQIETCDMDGTTEREIFRDISPQMVLASIVESTRREPHDPSHWKRLARIQFYLANYDEAQEAANRGLEVDANDINLRLILGAILAEKGIASGSRPLLVRAKEIFAFAVEKLGRPEDYYNFGNVQSELDDWDGAQSSYERCVAQKPEHARCWKNLGSIHARKKKYSEAKACFEKALAVNPGLVEGHYCQGTLILETGGKPEDAIACFETAFSADPRVGKKWAHIWYWYGFALWKAGDPKRALEITNRGLVQYPDGADVLGLKAALLRELWRSDGSYRMESVAFFTFKVTAVRNDYACLYELIELLRSSGLEEKAWEFVDRALDRGTLSLVELCRRSGISIQGVSEGLDAHSVYRSFRERHPADDHFVVLCQHGLSPDPTAVPALHHALMMSFGRASKSLREIGTRDKAKLRSTFSWLLEEISKIFASMGSRLLAADKPGNMEERIQILSKGMVVVPELALREASRQFGYLIGVLKLPVFSPGKKSFDWYKTCGDCTARFFEQSAKDWEWDSDATKSKDGMT